MVSIYPSPKSYLLPGIVVLVIIGAVIFGGLKYFKSLPVSISTNRPAVPVPSAKNSNPVATSTAVTSVTKSVASSTPVSFRSTNTPAVIEFSPEGIDRFIISLTGSTTEKITDQLFEAGYIDNKITFRATYLAKGAPTIGPGGYKLSKDMTAAQIITILKSAPYMKWVIIPPGLRKEEIGELLGKALEWSPEQVKRWNTTYTNLKFDYIEGVYAPDTYLIPVDETPLEVSNRLTAKFNEKFTPYLTQFNAQNIKWTTGLTLASIVQREAANTADMPLIAGILWNRLDQNMTLNVDATLQYIRGDMGKGWWAPITVADKQLDSPYNTYKYKGLPPHPISNPGLAAIEAVLHPASTTCLYYLHDKNKVTHCAVTYEEHLDNIEKYLKNQ